MLLAAWWPLVLLGDLGANFYYDWHNHQWFVGYFGEYFRQHGAMPQVLNAAQITAMPQPIFYGWLFYPTLGFVSAVTGAALALRDRGGAGARVSVLGDLRGGAADAARAGGELPARGGDWVGDLFVHEFLQPRGADGIFCDDVSGHGGGVWRRGGHGARPGAGEKLCRGSRWRLARWRQGRIRRRRSWERCWRRCCCRWRRSGFGMRGKPRVTSAGRWRSPSRWARWRSRRGSMRTWCCTRTSSFWRS